MATIVISCGKEVTGISLNKSTLALAIGEQQTLTATVSPAKATDKSVSWSSQNPTIATVVDGVVVGKAEGSTTITAKAGNFTAICEVTVADVEVTGILLNKPTLTLKIGEWEALSATVLPATATNKTVSWLSMNPTIATVSDGIVVANSNTLGNATIIAKAGNFTATCEVTVAPPSLAGTYWEGYSTGPALCKLNLVNATDFTYYDGVSTRPGTYSIVNYPTITLNFSSGSTMTGTITGDEMYFRIGSNVEVTLHKQ